MTKANLYARQNIDNNTMDNKNQQTALRLAILTQEPHNYSNSRMIEAAKARGFAIDCLETRRCYLSMQMGKPQIHYKGQALAHYDAIIPRIGSSMTFYGMAVIRQFEQMGIYCLNNSTSIGISRDKLHAHQLLAAHNIDMPATAFARSNQDSEAMLNSLGGTPLIIKLLESTQGRGVILAKQRDEALRLIKNFRNLGLNFLVQDFIQEAQGSDLRCLIINGKIIGAMLRTAKLGEFRSNVHQGGSVKPAKLSTAEAQIALNAAKVMQLNVAGVDILRSKTGPKVLEVNSSPGLQGIEAATGHDIAGTIMDYISEHIAR